nr:hypothetical protein [Francisella halioticida]
MLLQFHGVLYYSNNKAPNNDADLVSKVTHILHNVDIAKGVVADQLQGKKMFDHTAYVVIKNLNNNKLYISTYYHPNDPVVVDLNTLDKDNSKGFDIVLEKLAFPNNDITNALVNINKK